VMEFFKKKAKRNVKPADSEGMDDLFFGCGK